MHSENVRLDSLERLERMFMLITNIYDDISAYFERIDKGMIWNYTKDEKACNIPHDGSFAVRFPLCRLLGFTKDGKKHGKWSGKKALLQKQEPRGNTKTEKNTGSGGIGSIRYITFYSTDQ